MGGWFFLIIVGVVIYNIVKGGKAKQEQWRAAAENLGLEFHAGDLGVGGRISGSKGGHGVLVASFTKNSGGSSKTFTRYRIDYRERIPVDFKITRQHAFHQLGEIFGMEDIVVGSLSFDSAALIRGKHPEAVRDFLSPDRQETILRLLDAYNDVVVSNDFIELKKPGRDSDSAIIIHTVRVLLSVCNDLTDTSSSVAEACPTIKTEEPPPLSGFEPPALPPEAPSPAPPPVPEVPKEGAEVGVVPDAPLVEDEDVIPDEPAQPEDAPVVEIEMVATVLYGGDSGSSLLTSKHFEEQFKDRLVKGSGTLKRVSKFSYDPVFTNYTGVKASFDVLTLAGAYSKIKVTAEVRFPPEEYAALKAKVGRSLPISGMLIAQDAMMNQLYIADS